MKKLHLIICVCALTLTSLNVAKAADIELSVRTFIPRIEVGYLAARGQSSSLPRISTGAYHRVSF